MLNKYVTGNFRGVICIKRVKQKHNAYVVAGHLNVQLRNCRMDFADTWYWKLTLKCIGPIKLISVKHESQNNLTSFIKKKVITQQGKTGM
jgi:hypothetical protein